MCYDDSQNYKATARIARSEVSANETLFLVGRRQSILNEVIAMTKPWLVRTSKYAGDKIHDTTKSFLVQGI